MTTTLDPPAARPVLSADGCGLAPTLDGHLDALRALVSSLDGSSLQGELAADLVERFSALEHVCAAGKAICARRVAETGHFGRAGHKDAAGWLASVSGETHAGARELLEAAGRLGDLPALDEAFRSGQLSGKEAAEIAGAAALDPRAEVALLEVALQGSLGELRSKAAAIRAAARSKEDEEARHARIHKGRHLSTWTDREGAFVGKFSLTPEDGAFVMGRLQPIADRMFDEARREQRTDSRAAYLADALVALAKGECPAADGQTVAPVGRPSTTVLMHVDLDALIRGHVEPGEECVIDGTGHVPVSVVRSYLDTSRLRLVVTKGTDIVSIFSFSRTIPAALRTALEHRDRTCVVPGCTSTFHLEIDHIREVSKRGPTCLANLCRLCRWHHSLKTQKGYRIRGGPGDWEWLPPSNSPYESGAVVGNGGSDDDPRPPPGPERSSGTDG